MIEALYDFKKYEIEFTKTETDRILKDHKVVGLTFNNQILMSKWIQRQKQKKNNKNRKVMERIKQELGYKPVQE